MISSFANYVAALGRPAELIAKMFQLVGAGGGNLPYISMLPTVGTAFAAPGAPAIPSRTDPHALGQRDSLGVSRLARISAARPNTTLTGGALVIDRLSHQSGLSANVTGEQTTNLPTAPLTRYIDGVGVMVGVQAYAGIGASVVDVSARYTNHAGVAGRVTPAVPLAAFNFAGIAFFFQLPLQAGDKGVRSVEGITLSAGTGTAGNIGVTLFRPLPLVASALAWQMPAVTDALLAGFFPTVPTDACLQVLTQGYSTTGGMPLEFTFIEDDAP